MANGYLGKISAIVTANTSDFSNKLNSAAKEVKSFASSMQSAISRAQSGTTSSLRGIYTEVQKLERALQSASTLKLSFKGFDASKFGSVEEAANQMRRMVSASEQVYKPLANAAKATESLSTAVRAEFQPSLIAAQRQAELLNTALTKGTAPSEEAFARVTRRVNETEAAIKRLAEAGSMVANLSKGDSMRFTSPRSFDALTQAAASQNASSNLSATTLARFGVGQQQGAVAVAAQRVRDLEARRENEILLGQSTVSTDKLIAQETDRLEAQIRVLNRRNEAAQKYALIARGGFVSSDALAKSAKGMDKGAFVSSDDLASQAMRVRRDVLQRLENSGNFVSSDTLAKSAKGMDRGTFQPLGDLEKAAADLRQTQVELRRLKAEADFGGSVRKAFDTSQVDAYKAKLVLLRQILIAAGISGGQAAKQVDALALALQRAAESDEGIRGAAASLAAAEKSAASAVAAVTGRSQSAVASQLKRAGDIGRMGFDKFSLAANQAAFAIDDFFSSTGGLEFKLRAVSNNITQLAFILGGTTGLFIGLGAVIGGQLALAIAKFAFGLEDAKKREEAMKAQAESLNNALQTQKTLVESLADAYRELAKDIKQATLTPREARFEGRRDREREIRQQQADRRRETAATIVPDIAAGRGRIAQAEKQANELPMGAERAKLERQVQRLRDQENRRFEELDRQAAGLVGRDRGGLQDRRDFFQARVDNLQRDRARSVGRFGENSPQVKRIDADLNDAAKQLAVFTLALQRIADEASSAAADLAGPLQDRIQAARDRIQAQFGETGNPALDALNKAGRRLSDAVGGAGDSSPAKVERTIKEIEKLAEPALRASKELADFAESLNKSQDVARQAEQQAVEMVRSLEVEAARNPNDRGVQARLDAARAGAQSLAAQRQAIEAQVQRGLERAAPGEDLATQRQAAEKAAGGAKRFADDLSRNDDLITAGLELASTEVERFGKSLALDLEKLGAAAQAEPARADEILRQGRANLVEQAAPMFAQFAERALPSRAALSASDVATSQGQAELNRLLRGDDSAKDINLAEMKSQTQKLTSIDSGIQKLAQQIGVAQ